MSLPPLSAQTQKLGIMPLRLPLRMSADSKGAANPRCKQCVQHLPQATGLEKLPPNPSEEDPYAAAPAEVPLDNSPRISSQELNHSVSNITPDEESTDVQPLQRVCGPGLI